MSIEARLQGITQNIVINAVKLRLWSVIMKRIKNNKKQKLIKKKYMKNILKLCWYYLEIAYVSLLHMVGVEFSTDSIPCGLYCYEYDKERNINEPFDEGGYWVKPCKYYRSVSKFHIYGCTYIGFLGYSSFLSDQCKMCEEKEEIKAENLDCN